MAQYLRVSEILSRLQDFSTIDPAILDNKKKIGTNVHKAILDDSEGSFPLLESEREAAYFGSYMMWKKKEHPKFKIQVPRLYCHELMITGEIDGLIEGQNKPILVDWKCSANAHEEIWSMQAHFYWYLLQVNGIEVADRMLWINLRQRKWRDEDGSGQVVDRYAHLAPKVCEFQFNENVLSRCIEEANKAWEEKKNSLVVDF